jgi:NhaA family Na+:H+ antiporter
MAERPGSGDPQSQGHIPSDMDAPALEYVSPLKRFLHHDMVGSGALLVAALGAIVLANIGYYEPYHDFWESHFGFTIGDREIAKSLHHWVNDGLMAIFFFLVGLEIKRELLAGELAGIRKALLPVAAALGGMVFPAAIYAAINIGGDGAHGWGIPMATDIAFAAGCIALLKKWVPASLMVFLVALAIVDDLGAVTVIAIFYTDQIEVQPLFIGSMMIVVSFCCGKLGVRNVFPYAVFGIIVWVAFLESGVHATIAGVLLAFSIPADARYKTHLFEGRMKELLQRFTEAEREWETGEHGDGQKMKDVIVNQRQQGIIRAMNTECLHVEAPLQRLEYNIEPFAAFLIMPIFAFANAGVHLPLNEIGSMLMEPVTLGVFFGLVVGKPLGVFVFSYVTVKLGLASLPRGVTWPQLAGVGLLAGIGFTMSLFINGLAFAGADPEHVARLTSEGKLGIFAASLVAAVAGLLILKMTCRNAQPHMQHSEH